MQKGHTGTVNTVRVGHRVPPKTKLDGYSVSLHCYQVNKYTLPQNEKISCPLSETQNFHPGGFIKLLS